MAAAITERRLFFALWPDEAVRVEIGAKMRAWLAVGASGARAVPHANLHLTLAYLGAVPVARMRDLLDAARSVEPRRFELRLERTGWWCRPRVAWLAPRRIPGALVTLEAELWAALTPLGWQRDHARFRPHVTVARKQRNAPPPCVFSAVAWDVSAFVLCESVSTPDGVRYRVLDRWSA